MKILLSAANGLNRAILLILLLPLCAMAETSSNSPVELTASLSAGENINSVLQRIVFQADHPGASSIVDVAERVLLVNGEDRTAQTTLTVNSNKSFSVIYQPTGEFPLPQGDVAIEFVIPGSGWKWWKRDKNEARLQFGFYVDSISPTITQISPAPGEVISDLLQKLVYSVTDGGSGIEPASLRFFIDGNDSTGNASLAGSTLTYTPTNSAQLPQQDFEATLKAADKLGNLTSVSFAYQVQHRVVLSATPRATPQSAYAPATIRFSPEVTTNHAIVGYWWDFDGNGSFDRSDIVGNSYTWQYTKPGDYKVALKVQETYGEVVIGYTTVHILNGEPTVKAEASPSNGEIPLTVSFSATASDNEGISLYEWDFDGDGTYEYHSASSAAAQHTYTDPGQYTPTLRVTDGLGEATIYTLPTTTVHAAPPGSPTVTAASSPKSGTVPLAVSLSATATDPENKPFILWEWDFDGDGTFDYSDSQSATLSHFYDRAGTYYPIVRVTTDDNRTSVDAVAVEVLNSLSLSRNLDTVDTALDQTVQIKTTLGGTTRVSLVIEDSSYNVVRTLVDWTERTGGTYTDSWNGLKDNGAMAAESDYYAVLLYEENGLKKRLDLRNSSGGASYNPARNEAARTFAPFDNNPMSITYHLPVASEVTAFMGYSYSNTRVVTFLSRKPQGKGAHTILWYGTNNEGVVIYPPSGSYFMFGVWAYRLADNGIYLKSGSYVLNVSAEPPLFDPTSPSEDGRLAVSRITFSLTGDAAVELSVTDAQTGTLAASRTYNGLVAGENTIKWDGRNSAGDFLAPGRYRLGLTALDDNGSRSLTEYTLQRIYY